MGTVNHWLHDHHLLPDENAMTWSCVVDLLKTQWVVALLLVTGIMAVITAVLVSWPVIAFIGSRLFG